MKQLCVTIILTLTAFVAQASDWVIHGALGTNPGIGFSKCENGTLAMMQRMYGVAPDWESNFDGWVDPAVSVVVTNGSTLIVDGSWTTSAIICEDYSSCSSWNWAIEDGYPYFNGGSSQDMESFQPGEYWVDWSALGAIRILTAQPSDFGKYGVTI